MGRIKDAITTHDDENTIFIYISANSHKTFYAIQKSGRTIIPVNSTNPDFFLQEIINYWKNI